MARLAERNDVGVRVPEQSPPRALPIEVTLRNEVVTREWARSRRISPVLPIPRSIPLAVRASMTAHTAVALSRDLAPTRSAVVFECRGVLEFSAVKDRGHWSFLVWVSLDRWKVSEDAGRLTFGIRAKFGPSKRMVGFEPTTFALATRRSNQLSYMRKSPQPRD